MKVVMRRPSPQLADFIDVFWYCENPNPGHRAERVLPDGRTALVINLVDDRLSTLHGDALTQRSTQRGIAVAGVYSTHVGLDPLEQRRIMGVHFKPGGMRPFFAPGADLLANRDISLDSLWGRDADRIHQQLIEAPSPAAKFGLLEDTLVRRAPRPIQRHPAVAQALQVIAHAPALERVTAIQRDSGLSPKRFIALFRDEVGLTPKRYCRVRRFRRVLESIERGRRVDWVALAADCGYYDQAHFIRDFREFSGWNPSAFLAIRGERINHIPLPDSAAMGHLQ